MCKAVSMTWTIEYDYKKLSNSYTGVIPNSLFMLTSKTFLMINEEE